MNKEHITKGEVKQNGMNGIHLLDGTCVALSHNGQSKYSDSQLISETFNVFNETNLTPRELLEQRNELLILVEDSERFLNSVFKHDLNALDAEFILENIKKAIERAKACYR